MNTTLLINAIVRQTMVLVASLATASGQRAQLASVANLAFADLVRELREQELGNKVIADMFGLALRTYHRKVARLMRVVRCKGTRCGKPCWPTSNKMDHCFAVSSCSGLRSGRPGARSCNRYT